MRSATKVLLESIQVARHVGRIGVRPLEKGALQTAKAAEELAFWTLRLQPLEDFLGRSRTKELMDHYLQVKEFMADGAGSMGQQGIKSALQACTQASTALLRAAGAQARVIGPFDEHWNTLKVIKDLRAEHEAQHEGGGASLRMTPKRFVRFMREAERRKKRTQGRDVIDGYVEYMLSSGNLRRMGPKVLEKKLYTDVVRILCFAFDRAIMQASGSEIWGHELLVSVLPEQASTPLRIARRSAVGAEQLEAVVEQMLNSPDLQVPVAMRGIQRRLLVNCSTMILQLLEDLTSDRNMSVSMLGHHFRICLEPLPLAELGEHIEATAAAAEAQGEGSFEQRFGVNKKAIDQLVEALIDEPEVQLVLVPDLLEAEVYRYALHRTICIAQFILSQLKVRLFGVEVRLSLVAEEDAPSEEASAEASVLSVSPSELRALTARLEDERHLIEVELRARLGDGVALPGAGGAEAAGGGAGDAEEALEMDASHEFEGLAAQDRLSRSLSVRRTVPVPIDLAYRMVADFEQYPSWMPFCTSARLLDGDTSSTAAVAAAPALGAAGAGAGAPAGPGRLRGEVGFGLETGTILGTVGDRVTYHFMMAEPSQASGASVRTARVVADTADGFAYAKRLVYDWRFSEVSDGETDVRLDMFFQAKSVFYLPLWDSMQATITGAMMKKFMERATELGGTSADVGGSAAPLGNTNDSPSNACPAPSAADAAARPRSTGQKQTM